MAAACPCPVPCKSEQPIHLCLGLHYGVVLRSSVSETGPLCFKGPVSTTAICLLAARLFLFLLFLLFFLLGAAAALTHSVASFRQTQVYVRLVVSYAAAEGLAGAEALCCEDLVE